VSKRSVGHYLELVSSLSLDYKNLVILVSRVVKVTTFLQRPPSLTALGGLLSLLVAN